MYKVVQLFVILVCLIGQKRKILVYKETILVEFVQSCFQAVLILPLIVDNKGNSKLHMPMDGANGEFHYEKYQIFSCQMDEEHLNNFLLNNHLSPQPSKPKMIKII